MTPQFGSKAPVWFIYFHFFCSLFVFFSLKHSKPDVLHRSDIYFGTESRNLPDKKKSLRTILESGRSGTEVGEARALSVGDSKGTHGSERAARCCCLRARGWGKRAPRPEGSEWTSRAQRGPPHIGRECVQRTVQQCRYAEQKRYIGACSR